MHIEPPESAPRHLKEFLRQYLMIVLSILTALALEQGALAIHHGQAADAARVAIQNESKANIAELRKALEANLRVQSNAASLYKDFLAAAKSGSQADQLAVLQRERVAGLSLPSLRSDAWAGAIANQAVNHLSAEELRRFSERYTVQKDVMQAVSNQILSSDLLSQLAALQFAADAGTVDTAADGKALLRYASVIQEVNAEMKQLLALLSTASS